VTNLGRLFHAVFQVQRKPRPQDAGTPSLSSVLTSESDSGPGKGLHRQSNLPRSLHRLQIQLYSAIAVVATCPRMRVTEKSQLFLTNCRSGWDRESNPAFDHSTFRSSRDEETNVFNHKRVRKTLFGSARIFFLKFVLNGSF
jgi:hypothetical protein